MSRQAGTTWFHIGKTILPSDLATSWLTFSAPVAAARNAGRPLVALESTIIAHGMPYPETCGRRER